MLVALFHARLDPDGEDREAAASEAIQASIVEALDAVTNLDEDRILRRYLYTILAILRTNLYQVDENGGIDRAYRGNFLLTLANK